MLRPDSPPLSDSPQRPEGGGIDSAAQSLREVAVLALPFVLTQLLFSMMGLVDAAIVGRLGARELAAVGLSGTWLWTIASFFIGAASVVQTFVAQDHGAGRERDCGGWAWQGIGSTVPFAIASALFLLFAADSAIAWIAPSEGVESLSADYLRARAPGLVGLTAAIAVASFFRGIGDARTPLLATVFANGANVFLDFGLVYGWFGFPELGVFGAGLATSISEWLYLAFIACAFLRPSVRARFATGWRMPRLAPVRRLWRIGLPVGGQWVVEMLAYSLFTTLVARMGDAAMAASHAFGQLASLSFMQAAGISTATATLVGRYIGAGQPDRAAQRFRSSLVLGGSAGAAIAIAFLVVPESLVGLFSNDPGVLALGAPLLAIGAFYQLFDALSVLSDGALRGAGDTRWPFVIRCLAAWLIFLPSAWLLAYRFELGLTGAWIGGVFSSATLAIVLYRRFQSGAWRGMRI
ncbi:MAG: MATE family efflux transporter [Myxococcota bacterium]